MHIARFADYLALCVADRLRNTLAMCDDLKVHYQSNVVASYSEYRDVCSNGTTGRGNDLRSALVAASALFHLREHLPNSIPSRADVERGCPDYALLGDVVNASKHKVLSGQTPHGTPLITSADKLFEQLELTEYKDEIGFYQHIQKVVIAQLLDSTERNLLEILTNVLNFWERHLCTIGAIPVARVFTHDCAVRYRTRIECEANDLNFEDASGDSLSRPMRFFRFDTATGSATQVDAASYRSPTQMRNAAYNINLSLTHSESKEKYPIIISMSAGECVALSRILSVEQRKAFLSAIASAQTTGHGKINISLANGR